MPDEITGGIAGAPPAPSMSAESGSQVERINLTDALMGNREDTSTRQQDDAADDADNAGSRSENIEPEADTTTPLDTQADTKDTSVDREKFIPRERFDQVNSRLAELEAKQAEVAQYEAYKPVLETIDQYAKQYGMTPEQLLAAQQADLQRQQEESYIAQARQQVEQDLAARGIAKEYLDETAINMMEQMKVQNLRTQATAQQAERMVAMKQHQDTVDAQVSTLKSSFKDIPEAFSPTVEKQVKQLLSEAAPQYVGTAAKALEGLLRDTANATRAAYATKKGEQTDRTSPAPEGAGGQPRVSAGAPVKLNPAQLKGGIGQFLNPGSRRG